MQIRPPPMAAAAAMKRTMRKNAKVVVEFAIDAVLLAPRTKEQLSSLSGTQSCKDFTKWIHIMVANRR